MIEDFYTVPGDINKDLIARKLNCCKLQEEQLQMGIS